LKNRDVANAFSRTKAVSEGRGDFSEALDSIRARLAGSLIFDPKVTEVPLQELVRTRQFAPTPPICDF